jgi:hypothetical protein
MFRIIYCLLLLGISICSMASIIWLLSLVGFELLLVAGGCIVAFIHWRPARFAPPWKGRSPNSLPIVVASTL